MEGNRLSGLGGDGSVMNTTQSPPLVQHNRVDGFNKRSDGYTAGSWPHNANDTPDRGRKRPYVRRRPMS